MFVDNNLKSITKILEKPIWLAYRFKHDNLLGIRFKHQLKQDQVSTNCYNDKCFLSGFQVSCFYIDTIYVPLIYTEIELL